MIVRLGAALVAALTVVMSAAPASAAKIHIKNATAFPAAVHMSYAGCRGDSATVAPGATFSINVYACLIRAISATLTGGPAVHGFTSSGTRYESYAIVVKGAGAAVEQR